MHNYKTINYAKKILYQKKCLYRRYYKQLDDILNQTRGILVSF